MFAVLAVVLLSAAAYTAAVLFTLLDKEFVYRWLAFSLSLVPVVLTGFWITVILSKNKFKLLRNGFHPSRESVVSVMLLVAVLAFAAALRFLFLKTYPFVSVSDELRDGGLHAFQIASGVRKEIFGYGVYESHGLIIATLVSFLFRLFHNSVYTFRVAAALVGIADVFFLYVFVHRSLNKWAAFFAALVLACLPIHLYYSRSEIVVIFSSFWTSVMLLSVFLMIRKKTTPFIIWTGTVLGFAAGFHTSVRTVVFTASLICLTLLLGWVIRSFIRKKERIRRMMQCALFAVFFFIGFGPRILYSPPHVFFQSRSLYVSAPQTGTETDSVQVLGKTLTNLQTKYVDSFLVYVYNATISHYYDHQPILSPFLALFFVVGLVVTSLLLNGLIWKLVALFVFLIPFTNSAMTEAVNNDHRLAPLFVFASLLSGVGIWFVISRFRRGLFVRWVFAIVVTCAILIQGGLFFLNQSASKDQFTREYLGMHLVYLLQQNKALYKGNYLCFRVHPRTAEYLDFAHVREQFEYFLPALTYDIINSTHGIGENEIFILKHCTDNPSSYHTFVSSCNPIFDFRCPITEPRHREFIFHVAQSYAQ